MHIYEIQSTNLWTKFGQQMTKNSNTLHCVVYDATASLYMKMWNKPNLDFLCIPEFSYWNEKTKFQAYFWFSIRSTI